jgi:hypothetical protein
MGGVGHVGTMYGMVNIDGTRRRDGIRRTRSVAARRRLRGYGLRHEHEERGDAKDRRERREAEELHYVYNKLMESPGAIESAISGR